MTVYISADIHGDKNRIYDIMTQLPHLSKEDTVIVAGDASLEYGNYNMRSTKKIMSDCSCNWLIMRGNHDNRYFENHFNDDSWHMDNTIYNMPVVIENKYPNIHYIWDTGGIYNVAGNKILFIPGAYSVDKDYRLLKGWPYTPREQLTEEEFTDLYDDFMESDTAIDYVVSHTCPLQLEPHIRYLFMNGIDQSKVDKTTEKWLDKFYNQIIQEKPFKHWYFGHFHDTKQINDKVTMLYRRVKKLGE